VDKLIEEKLKEFDGKLLNLLDSTKRAGGYDARPYDIDFLRNSYTEGKAGSLASLRLQSLVKRPHLKVA